MDDRLIFGGSGFVLVLATCVLWALSLYGKSRYRWIMPAVVLVSVAAACVLAVGLVIAIF